MLRLRRFLRPAKGKFAGGSDNGIPLGQTLCDAAGFEIADVFRHQFRLRPGQNTPLPGFSHLQIGDWTLDHGPDLPVALASFAGGAGHVAFLGLGVDTYGGVVGPQSLSALVAHLRSAEAVAETLCGCAGRYAFIVIQGSTQRLYLDPVGSLAAVYEPQEQRIASTLNLVLQRDVAANKAYPLTDAAISGSARFAFGHTADQRIARLLPNHYLNLSDFRQTRHWPGPLDLAEPADETAQADLVAGLVTRFEQVIAALVAHADHSYLALSGGVDSRVMLACAKPVMDQTTLLSYVENRMSRKDANIARRMAQALDQDLTVFDPRSDETLALSDQKIDRMDQAYRIATAARGLSKEGHEVAQAMQPGGLVLRGNITGLLKAVMWRKAVREYERGRPHDTGMGIKMMMLGGESPAAENADIRMEYEGWYSSLPVLAAKRPYDFMMSEQFLAHGMGNDFYGKRQHFHICPFNDRALIAAATSLPPDQRARFDYTDAIIEWRAPELAALPYSRRSVNQQRITKQENGVAALKIA